MKAPEKYKRIFGKIDSLGEEISWSTGISNMLEWLTWSTNDVLGVSKTKFWKLAVELSHEEQVRHGSLEEKLLFVKKRLETLTKESERPDRYDKPSSSIASPREVLRRVKFFSEDYLNKEFDIFWGLVSDDYLDAYYQTVLQGSVSITPGGRWYSHGNSGLFAYSTGIKAMQMDNLSYSPDNNLLIANELKLGGKKNKDQILKYALMYRMLVEREFIKEGTQFVLLFIGDREEDPQWSVLIDDEIKYCTASTKETLERAVKPECVAIARAATCQSTTWRALYDFNQQYVLTCESRDRQVERKLLTGFNESLSVKAFFQLND